MHKNGGYTMAKTIDIGICGTQHVDRNEIFKEKRRDLFIDILKKEWSYNGEKKQVWEYIRDNVLSGTPAFEGTEYKKAKTKVMFVGRALNGWEVNFKGCSTLEDIADRLLNQSSEKALDTLVCEEGFGEGPRKYRHKNYNFFRFIKGVLEEVGESDIGTDETWYNDSKKWNQKFIWANLFCISPYNGNNPTDKLIKPSIESYIKLIKLYIEHYRPDVIIFITDIDGWLRFDNISPSFIDLFGDTYIETKDETDFIRAKGEISGGKAIVCQRPDKRGTSHSQCYEYSVYTAKNIK